MSERVANELKEMGLENWINEFMNANLGGWTFCEGFTQMYFESFIKSINDVKPTSNQYMILSTLCQERSEQIYLHLINDGFLGKAQAESENYSDFINKFSEDKEKTRVFGEKWECKHVYEEIINLYKASSIFKNEASKK